MLRHVLATATAALLATGSMAATYWVESTDDAGPKTLRWAINQANVHAGPDSIRFRPEMSGKVIRPASHLPALRDSGTNVNGDIDGNGTPDVEIRGGAFPGGHGLQVEANHIEIRGLSITQMPWAGIWVWGCTDCVIQKCWIGLTADGHDLAYNREAGIALFYTDRILIGGTAPNQRNIIWPGPAARARAGIDLLVCHGTTVVGNYIGLWHDGTRTAANGGIGILMLGPTETDDRYPRARRLVPADRPAAIECAENVIGGTTSEERNVIGGVRLGVGLLGADRNTIAGNYLGLLPDGNSEAPIGQFGVLIGRGSAGNTIGGNVAGAANVFAGAPAGVGIGGGGTADNVIQGNYFGLNARGRRPMRLRTGILADRGGEGMLIGGGAAGARNYFAPNAPSGETFAIVLKQVPGAPVIRNNAIGVRPDGRDAPRYGFGVGVLGGEPRIRDNEIVNARAGVGAAGSSCFVRVIGNQFRRCGRAVLLDLGALGNLGNLGNDTPADDGGNVFDASCNWWIRNQTTNAVMAEGNDFGTTSTAEINAKIWDGDDRPGRGMVDFDPVIGGVHPTGTAAPALALTGAAAVPAARGAEIAFTLSAQGDVSATVLNIAARPVATIVRGTPLAAGLQRLSWDGRSDAGVLVPSGAYLVRIEARGDDGQQAQAVCPLQLRR